MIAQTRNEIDRLHDRDYLKLPPYDDGARSCDRCFSVFGFWTDAYEHKNRLFCLECFSKIRKTEETILKPKGFICPVCGCEPYTPNIYKDEYECRLVCEDCFEELVLPREAEEVRQKGEWVA